MQITMHHVDWKNLGRLSRFMNRAEWQNQQKPHKVFGYPLATGIQPSGFVEYKAYIMFNPPPTQNIVYSVTANFTTFAEGECTQGAKLGGSNAIDARGIAYDHAGTEKGMETSLAKIIFPKAPDQDSKSVTYPLNVAAGTSEILIGDIKVGLGYTIKAGVSLFKAVAKIEFLVDDAQGNHIITTPVVTTGGSGGVDGEDENDD